MFVSVRAEMFAQQITPENFGEQRRILLAPERLKVLKCFAGDLLLAKSRMSHKVRLSFRLSLTEDKVRSRCCMAMY